MAKELKSLSQGGVHGQKPTMDMLVAKNGPDAKPISSDALRKMVDGMKVETPVVNVSESDKQQFQSAMNQKLDGQLDAQKIEQLKASGAFDRQQQTFSKMIEQTGQEFKPKVHGQEPTMDMLVAKNGPDAKPISSDALRKMVDGMKVETPVVNVSESDKQQFQSAMNQKLDGQFDQQKIDELKASGMFDRQQLSFGKTLEAMGYDPKPKVDISGSGYKDGPAVDAQKIEQLKASGAFDRQQQTFSKMVEQTGQEFKLKVDPSGFGYKDGPAVGVDSAKSGPTDEQLLKRLDAALGNISSKSVEAPGLERD